MGGNRASDATGNPAPNQISLAKSLLIIGAATALGFLIGDSPTPDKEDEPFGEAQSRQEPMQTQLKRAKQVGRARNATVPTQIPWEGWRDIFRRAADQASA